MPTLTWIESTHGDSALSPLWDLLAAQVAELSAGRFDTRVRHVSIAAGGVRTPANRLFNDAAMLATSIDAARSSDVLVLGCWAAPTAPVRAAVDVPVSSLPDASVRAVGSLARRAVIVTVAPSLVPIFDDDLSDLGRHGFLDRGPVRAYDPESTHADVVDAIADPARLIDRFDAVARAAVDDGADAIVVGCGYLAPIFSAHGYTHVGGHPDVPVYDCNRLAFEHAVQLHLLGEAGIVPAPRSYASPGGVRADALASVAALLTSQEGTVSVA